MSEHTANPVDRTLSEIRKQVDWLEREVIENKLRMVQAQKRCLELMARLDVERRRLDQLTETPS